MSTNPLRLPIYLYRGARSLVPFVLWVLSYVLRVFSIALFLMGWVLIASNLLRAVNAGQLLDPNYWPVFVPALAWVGASELVNRISWVLLDAHDKLTGVER